MTTALQKSLTTISTHAKRINQVADEAAKTVSQVEEFFETNSVGIEAEVNVGNHEGFIVNLASCRIGERFRIVVQLIPDIDRPVEPEVKPWSDCNRETKLKSIAKLPELLNLITSQLANLLRDTEVAAKSLQTLSQVSPR